MENLSRLELFMHFGFRKDPFKSEPLETGDTMRISRIIGMAVHSNAMVSIVGERGAGKSQAVHAALKALNTRQVMVRSADKSKLLISDIEQAMIFDLSEEKPKRGREIRARQLRRVLGEASRKQKIVVIIEEGHRLHGMTLRALKTLREMDWMGEIELFSIVLLGQSDPMNKAGVAEVRLRSDSVHMHGLSGKEVAGYIAGTIGKIFDESAIEAVSKIPEARNFLDLQNILLILMGHAASDGRKRVTIEDVSGIYGKKGKGSTQAGKPEAHLFMNDAETESLPQSGDAIQNVLNRRRAAA